MRRYGESPSYRDGQLRWNPRYVSQDNPREYMPFEERPAIQPFGATSLPSDFYPPTRVIIMSNNTGQGMSPRLLRPPTHGLTPRFSSPESMQLPTETRRFNRPESMQLTPETRRFHVPESMQAPTETRRFHVPESMQAPTETRRFHFPESMQAPTETRRFHVPESMQAPTETRRFHVPESMQAPTETRRFHVPESIQAPTESDESKLTKQEQGNALRKLRKEFYNPTPKILPRRVSLYYRDLNRDPNTEAAEKHKDEDSKSCAVCLEDFEAKEEVMLTPCSHMFHEECIVPWVKNHGQCPVCRASFCERRQNASSFNHSNTNHNDNTLNNASSFNYNNANNNNNRRVVDQPTGRRVLLADELLSLIHAVDEAFPWRT